MNRAAKKAALGWDVDGERHPGPQDGVPLRGGAFERGSEIGSAWCVVSKPHAGLLPVTKGCSGVAEEGNSRNHPRSAGPSLGLLAHRTRATGSRRRKTSSRWMEWLCQRRQAFTGESGVGVAASEFVARGLWVSAASGEHTRGTKREEGCGLRHAAGTIARGSCSYVVF